MRNFGDFPPHLTDFNNSKVVILPVPYDGTSTWLKGANKGPEAILEASPNLEFYDIETQREISGINTKIEKMHGGKVATLGQQPGYLETIINNFEDIFGWTKQIGQ